ncbi:MAG TPA: hypothetical protein VIM62_06150, partial [Acidobacteriaceae bacterium]
MIWTMAVLSVGTTSAVCAGQARLEAWPDALVMERGKPVTSAAEFTQARRAELLWGFAENVFGETPHAKLPMAVKVTSEALALDGAAVRKQVTLTVGTTPKTRDLHLLLYLPAKAKGPVPVFIGLNFEGNASTTADPGVDMGEVWIPDAKETGIPLGSLKNNVHVAPEESFRGHDAGKWPFAEIVKAGYGAATMYAGDLEPDYATGIGFGVRPLFFRPGQYMPELHDWGAIGAWAWGLSRIADYLLTDKAVDGKALILTGHSRMGKAALWAAAQDERFAMVISNESGQGGAGLSHREAGETIWHLNLAFPYWFSGAFHAYNGRTQEYPLDGHLLLALIAPRPLFVASAEDDPLSDPKGEFEAARAASAVYRLYGTTGLAKGESFAVGKLMGGDVRYYCRLGKHDMKLEDWQ